MKVKASEKIIFFVSAVLLTFLYGYGTGAFGWPPGTLLDGISQQAVGYFGKPHYLAPIAYNGSGARIVDSRRLAPGLTLISTHVDDVDWRPSVRLIDARGRVLHRWRADPAELFPGVKSVRGVRPTHRRGVHGAYLFENGDVLVNLEYMGIARLDACGNVIWRRANGAHHSITPSDDGTFWVPATGPAALPTSRLHPKGFPGLDRPVNQDYLLNMTGGGEVLDSINMLDVLYENDLERFLVRSRVVVPTDLMHVNDVEALSGDLADEYPLFEAGDLLVSLRAADLILVVDPTTLTVKWHSTDPFVQQHDPDFIGDGWVGVFNNNWDGTRGGSLIGGSEILALQPHTDSLKVLYPKDESDPFYSEYLGKWQQLENGNLLLTEGRAGRVVEVDSLGRTVWEWVHGPYDSDNTVEVTEGTRYALDAENVLAWPCSESVVVSGQGDDS